MSYLDNSLIFHYNNFKMKNLKGECAFYKIASRFYERWTWTKVLERTSNFFNIKNLRIQNITPIIAQETYARF